MRYPRQIILTAAVLFSDGLSATFVTPITDKDGEIDGDDVHAAAHTLSEQVNSAVWTSGAEDDDLLAQLLDEGEDEDGAPKLPVYPENY